MLYIATTKTIEAVGDVKGLSAADKVVLFYRESDTCKMGDLKYMMGLSCPVDLIEYSDRDDMLIQLGGLFVSCDETFCLLDASIPTPKRYADRVVTDGQKKPAKKRSTVKKEKKKTEPEVLEQKDAAQASDQEPHGSTEGVYGAMNLPVTDGEDDPGKK